MTALLIIIAIAGGVITAVRGFAASSRRPYGGHSGGDSGSSLFSFGDSGCGGSDGGGLGGGDGGGGCGGGGGG